MKKPLRVIESEYGSMSRILSASNESCCVYANTMTQTSHAAHYRIVVEGVLDPMWLQCLNGFEAAEQRQSGQPVVTRLEGRPIDQSALQGVLDTLFMLGMRLILVECLPSAP
jgi:hypothetical protein